jgi:hypothetical protein
VELTGLMRLRCRDHVRGGTVLVLAASGGSGVESDQGHGGRVERNGGQWLWTILLEINGT